MPDGELGQTFKDGEISFRQGAEGNCMYFIIKGKVKISVSSPEGEILIATPRKGEIF